MLCRDLPDAVDRFVTDFNAEGLKEAAELAKKQTYIRKWLKNSRSRIKIDLAGGKYHGGGRS